MAILGLQIQQPTGLASVTPSVVYILTNNTYAEVTATGYLNAAKQEGFIFSNQQMALVYTSDEGPVWLKIVITYSGASVLNTVASLVQISSPGDVVLPTIVNHLMVSTDTVGTLANLTGTAINDGPIQAGRSTISGYLASFPAAATSGSLRLTAVANTGDTLVTISNALHGQASVYSIPDGGAATANFIISSLTGTQHITVGAFQVDAGIISSGISTGGTAGGFTAYPATTTQGSLKIVPVGNVGDFSTTISNDAAQSLAQVITIPDSGLASGNFILSSLVGSGIQHITLGSLEVDAGALISGIGTGGFVGLVKAFPTTAASGFVAIQGAVNATGDFGTTISNAVAQAQDQVMTVPDVVAATGQFLVKTAAFVDGNYPVASGTAGLMVDSGVPAQKLAQVTMSAAEWNGMYAAPKLLVASQGANTMIVVDSVQLVMTFVSANYANGGVVSVQYDSTINGAGVHASSDEAAADFFAAASTVFKLNGGLVLAPFTTCADKGLYLSNLTGAFDTGDSTWIIKVFYHVISTTA